MRGWGAVSGQKTESFQEYVKHDTKGAVYPDKKGGSITPNLACQLSQPSYRVSNY